VIDALDRAHTAVRFTSRDTQAVSGGQVREVSCQSIVARGQLLHLEFAVQLGKP